MTQKTQGGRRNGYTTVTCAGTPRTPSGSSAGRCPPTSGSTSGMGMMAERYLQP
jgi:hypothetical protein